MTIVTVDDPRQPEVDALVRASDAYAQSLYPSDACSSLALAELVADDVTVFVARNAVGLALGMAALVNRGDGTGELKRLFVDESGRGQGVATAVMGGLCLAADRFLFTDLRGMGIWEKGLWLGAVISVAGGAYLAVARLLRVEEIGDFLALAKRKTGR